MSDLQHDVENLQHDVEKIWTPANKVTLARILLIPVFVVAIISPWPSWFPETAVLDYWKPWVAAFVFIGISLTDMIDGHLARSRGEVTTLGKFLDPIADKLLVAAALLALVELGSLPSWVALIILSREFIVSGIRMVAAAQNNVIAASWYGKAKTVFQMIAIVLFIIKDSHFVIDMGNGAYWALYVFSWVIMSIALVLTVVSMIDYFAKASDMLGFSRKKSRKKATNSAKETKIMSEVKTETVHSAEALLAAQLIDLARQKNVLLATAESCTGGRIGAALTHVAGSSDVVKGGVISYSNEVKHQVLGVPNAILEGVGAVSKETAILMATGASRALEADLSVAVTGIAGPGGGTEEKPVGTVWIASSYNSATQAHLFHFEGDREQVRTATVEEALRILIRALDAEPVC